MIITGLTGGIATGKSTVSSFLKELGAYIIDADKIAYDAVQQGKPAWKSIVDKFGKDVLLSGGEINRPYLGNIIFNNPQKKELLNSIVHPHVFQEMFNQIEKINNLNPENIVILDVPLLIESGMHKIISDVILVYISHDLQLKRLIQRDNISENEALSRINSQISIDDKKKFAAFIIDNSSDLEETKKQSIEIYNLLKGVTKLPLEQKKQHRLSFLHLQKSL